MTLYEVIQRIYKLLSLADSQLFEHREEFNELYKQLYEIVSTNPHFKI